MIRNCSVQTGRRALSVLSFICGAAILVFLPSQAQAQPAETQPLEVQEVVDRVLEYDPAIRSARTRVEQAFSQYDLTRAGTLPDLTVNVTPYTFSRQRINAGPDAEIAETRSAAVGLGVRQALPTSGLLSIDLDHRAQVTRAGGDETVEQVPAVTFGYSQPLFFTDTVVGGSVFRAGMRSAEISYRRAGLAAEAQRNVGIRNALGLFVQVASLRRSVSNLDETITLLQRQIDAAELDREQGLLSDNAVLALQVTLNDRRETLFDTELALLGAEQQLARVLGEERLGGRPIEDDLESFPFELNAPGDGTAAVADNPLVQSGQLGVEQARMQGVLNDLTDRPQFDLSVSATPLYPPVREEPDDPATSLEDYFDSEADVSATVALSLRIPVLTRREREARETIDRTTEDSARITLEDTELATRNELLTLRINRDFLLRRQELLDTDIRYQEQRLRNEESLLAAGASTQLRVDEVALDLTSRRNERWQVSAELFLNAVDILAVQGTALAGVFESE